MTSERIKLHVDYSINGKPVPKELWYTEEEFNQGYHFCCDWDYLFVCPKEGSEWDSCSCHPLKKKDKKEELAEEFVKNVKEMNVLLVEILEDLKEDITNEEEV
jgi:hypothetical protein